MLKPGVPIHMKFTGISTLFLFLFSFGFAQPKEATIIKFNDLNNLINSKSDSLYVINFWATWCKPCMEELPYFLKAEQEFAEKPVKFIFISLDFKNSYDTRFLPRVKESKMKHAYLLNEPDYNSWIDKVDTAWQGSIPATLIVGNGKRYFAEKQFNFDELISIINNNLKLNK